MIENHPLSVLSDYSGSADPFFNSASLGLGPSSTVLKQLVDLGRVGRNVVGIYLGTRYPRAGGTQNGSIVLGGYDSGRIDGPAHEYKQVPVLASNASPFKVHVKQLSLVTANGDSIGLVTDDGFDGYISTSQYPVELPQSVTQRLATALNAKPMNNAENTLQAAQPFKGNLTITLDDGYEINFPSEWITNASNITPFSASSVGTNTNANSTAQTGPLILGAAFLHNLYLTADYESSMFSLAKAKLYDNYVQPQSLCPGELPAAARTPKYNKFLQMGLIGAILGGVIGGIGLTWFIVFVVRKRLQHRQSESAISRMEGSGAAPAPTKSSLRTRAKIGFAHLGNKKDKEDVVFKHVKRVSFTDSETSSINGITVTVTDKGAEENSQNIEMSHIQYNPNTKTVRGFSPVSPLDAADRLSTADTLNNSPHGGVQKPPSQSTTPKPQSQPLAPASLPTPDRFTNPYAASPQPTPLSLETPRTGNPLLGNFRGFTDFDDNDNSDIEAAAQRAQSQAHKRTPSEQMRAQLGLTVNTGVKSQKSSVKEVTAQRKKPTPLPLRVSSGSETAKRQVTKTEADYFKKNPVKALLGVGKSGGSDGKQSALRRMFPPPER